MYFRSWSIWHVIKYQNDRSYFTITMKQELYYLQKWSNVENTQQSFSDVGGRCKYYSRKNSHKTREKMKKLLLVSGETDCSAVTATATASGQRLELTRPSSPC